MSGNDTITKIRTEIEDELIASFDVHNYEGEDVFILWEANVEVSSIRIEINGKDLLTFTGATFSYDSPNNRVTISYAGFVRGDVIVIFYNCYSNYSKAVIKRYMRIALDKIAVFYPKNWIIENEGADFTIKDNDIDESTLASGVTSEVARGQYSLVAAITVLLIKPDWLQYRALDLGIRYNPRESREAVIKNIIDDFKDDRVGIVDII